MQDVASSNLAGPTKYLKELPGVPFQRVRVIEHVRRNKWKVEWIDPDPGLVDYVESGRTACDRLHEAA